MKVKREKKNPIIRPADIVPFSDDFEVIGVFNPGVTLFRGKVLLFLRVAQRPKDRKDGYLRVPVYNETTKSMEIVKFEKNDKTIDFSDKRVIVMPDGKRFLTSYSSFLVATSENGVDFDIRQGKYITPSCPEESFGIEDARITKLEDTYYINYSAASEQGIVTNLICTKDFETFERMGTVMYPDNKDMSIFPEKVGGKYLALHRPSTSEFGKPEIWLAQSPDLLCWGNHKHLMSVREGKWDETRIGSSSVPIRTEQGWLEIYHGADRNNRYCLGAVLLDEKDPSRVLARLEEPFLFPEEKYEKEGFFKDVVFACGNVVRGDEIDIYYGASDEFVAKATVSVRELLDALLKK